MEPIHKILEENFEDILQDNSGKASEFNPETVVVNVALFKLVWDYAQNLKDESRKR